MQLGAFELIRILGRGGMGEVWAARHRDGWPVAVKVLTSEAAQVPAFRYAFQAEVRAIAGLNHPAIVSVYDQGQAGAQMGQLEGNPYLVMERGVGTLRAVLGELEWSVLREVLLTILEALAHAHAHGILHRDLKPSNLLRMQDGSLRLSDFGLVYPMGAGQRPKWSITAGTPSFMAPEQILGSWRDWGPWTDLYAFGCLAWTLASGEPPFRASTPEALYGMHLEHPVPDLRPALAVGEGFQAWLNRLLQKEPQDRFLCAADAAHAFVHLVGVRGNVPGVPKEGSSSTSLPEPTGTLVLEGAQPKSTKRTEPPSSVAPMLIEQSNRFPSWKRGLRSTRSAFPQGVGLGIYGLRALPLVGREGERDLIWRSLRQVHRDGAPRVVVLRGASGTGKSRLATWVAERAHELGVSRWLRANHEPVQGPDDGLLGLGRRSLRSSTLGPDERRRVVRTWALRRGPRLGGVELDRLVALASEDAVHRLPSAEDRTAAINAFLAREAHDRPLILICDDIQWGRETFDYVSSMLRDGRLPVLVVMTVREESLDTRLAARIDALAARHIALGALSSSEQARLIRELLGLEPELAAEVERRSAGNPLFAVQLVGDWVQRGALQEGAGGFSLKQDVQAVIPDDLHALWGARLDYVLQGDEGARRVLGVAAALGNLVKWDELLAASGVETEVVREIVGRLAEAQLVTTHGGSFEFIHGLLRESLERTAREENRWESHHRAVADALEAAGAPEWRSGKHRLEAGEYERAMEPLLRATDRFMESAFPRRANAALDAFVRAADGARLAQDDRRRAQAGVFRAAAMLNEDTASAIEMCEHFRVLAQDAGWADLEAETLRLKGEGLSRASRLQDAYAAFQEALDVGEDAKDWRHLISCWNGFGMALLHGGRLDDAERSYSKGAELAEARGDMTGLVGSRIGLGIVAHQADEQDKARRFALEALELASESDAVSSRMIVAAYNVLGEVARANDDLEAARRAYEEGLRRVRGTGYVGEATLEGNLGHVGVAAGRYAEARQRLLRAVKWLDETGHARMAHEFRFSLLAVYAALRDWTAFDDTLQILTDAFEEEPFVAPDVAQSTRIAGQLCEQAGEMERASRVWSISRDAFEALQRPDNVASVERHLDALDSDDD